MRIFILVIIAGVAIVADEIWWKKPQAREKAMKEYFLSDPYVGLYKQSRFARKEWDMIALFANGSEKFHCEHAKKSIAREVFLVDEDEYKCMQIPEDWRQRPADEIIHTSRQLGP